MMREAHVTTAEQQQQQQPVGRLTPAQYGDGRRRARGGGGRREIDDENYTDFFDNGDTLTQYFPAHTSPRPAAGQQTSTSYVISTYYAGNVRFHIVDRRQQELELRSISTLLLSRFVGSRPAVLIST